MSLLRASLIVPRRAFSTTLSARRADNPLETESGASVKADKSKATPQQMQQETARKANQPSNTATKSEEAVHAEKHSKSPQQLQKETAAKQNQ